MASTFNISVGGDTSKLERDIQQAANRLRKPVTLRIDDKASSALGNITGKATKFNDALDAATARVVAFGVAAGAFNLVRKGVEELLRSTVEVESSLARININLNESQEGLKQFSKNIFDIARNTGQTFETAAKAAEELTRQGLTAVETSKRLRDALILSRLAAIDSGEAVNTLTASINSFSKEALDSTEILNKLAAVDAKFAVSANDLAQAVSRVGSSASEAGVSFDELLAIVTSVQQTTARGGAVIGNALKTIFTRVERSGTLNDLEALGIGVRDIEGNALPAIQVLKNLASTYDTLSQSQRSLVAEQVGGVFQINILKAALGDLSKEYSIYDRALAVAAGASDEALRKNDALNKTLAASFNDLRQSLTELFAEFGKINLSPFLKTITDGLSGVAKFLSGTKAGADAGKTIGENIMQGIGNVLTGPGVVALAAIVQSVISTLARKVGAEFGQALSSSLLASGALTGIGQAGKVASVRTISTKRAAEGLLPSIAGESASIRAGVGGAFSSAKPVIIPNFAFGGGKRGTVVANTSEYIVPNYANGGSAIFNQDMVRSMGLPMGAQKLATGFIPNFANIKSRKIPDIEGMIRVMETENGSELKYYRDKKTGKINIDYLESQKKGDAFQLFNELGKRAKRLGSPIYTGVLEPQLRQINKKASNFDNLLTVYPQLRYRDQSGLKTQGQLTEIEADGLAKEKTFRSLSSLKSFVNSMRQPDFIKKLVNDNIRLGDIQTSFAAGGFIPNFAGSQANYFRKYFNLSGNSPLDAAIDREIGAGVAPGNIYIDSDKRISSRNNPLGLLVANRKDEPSGGFQGVNRVLGQGGNPATAGMAVGYVPNFATYGDRPDAFSREDFTNRGYFISSAKLKELNNLFNTMSKVNGKGFDDALKNIQKIEKEIGGKAGGLITGRRLTRLKQRNNLAFPATGEPFEDAPAGTRGSGGGAIPLTSEQRDLRERERLATKILKSQRTSGEISSIVETIKSGGVASKEDIDLIRREEEKRILRSEKIFKGIPRASIDKSPRLKELLDFKVADSAGGIFKASQENIRQQAARKSQSRLLGLSIVSSFAAPAIESLVGGGAKSGDPRAALGGLAGGALQGAGIGAIFGPQGAAIGAVAGGLVGAFSKLTKSAEDFNEELNNATAEQTKSVDALQQYLQTRGELDEANARGASSKVTDRLEEKLAEQFSNIRPDIAEKIKGATSSETFDILRKESASLDRNTKLAAQKSSVFGLTGDTSDSFGTQVKGNLKTGARVAAGILTFFGSEALLKNNPFTGNGKAAELAGRQIGSDIGNKDLFKNISGRRDLISLLGNQDAGKFEKNRDTLQKALSGIPAFKDVRVTAENFNDLNIALNQAATTSNNLSKRTKELANEEKRRAEYFSKIAIISGAIKSNFETREISKQGLQERRGAFEQTRLSLIEPTLTAQGFGKAKLESQLKEAGLQQVAAADTAREQFKIALIDIIGSKGAVGQKADEAIASGNTVELLKLAQGADPEAARKANEDYYKEIQKGTAIANEAKKTIEQRNALESAYESIQRKRTAFLNAPSLGGNEALNNLTGINKLINTSSGNYDLRRIQKTEAVLGVGNDIKSLTGSDKFLTSDFTSLIGKAQIQKQNDASRNFAANVLQSVFYQNPSSFRTDEGGLRNSKFYETSLRTGIKNTSGEDKALLQEALAQLLDQSKRKSPEDDTKELFKIQADLLKQQQESIDKLGKTKVTIDTIVNGTINVISDTFSEGQTALTKELIRDAVMGIMKRVTDVEAKMGGKPNPPSPRTVPQTTQEYGFGA